MSEGATAKRFGVLVGSTLLFVVAAYGLWFLHEGHSFKIQANETGNALFIEQVEALRAIKGASIDKYQERLALTLRDQLTRIREVRRSGDVLSPQVQRQLQFICHQAPEVVALAQAVPHEGSGDLCSST